MVPAIHATYPTSLVLLDLMASILIGVEAYVCLLRTTILRWHQIRTVVLIYNYYYYYYCHVYGNTRDENNGFYFG
jgi:hypothetical protein